MTPQVRALVVGLGIGLFVAVAPSCSGTTTPATCDAMSCSTGCCSSSGECITSTSNSQCGNAGALCRACSTGQMCTNGACVTAGAGGGSGTAGGTGGTAGGNSGTAGGAGTAGGGRAGGTAGTAGGTGGTAGGTGGTTGGTAGGTGGTAGGTAGGTSGTAGGNSGTAGGNSGTAGGSGAVQIQFATNCPAFTPCGGNVSPTASTTWTITNACVADSDFAIVTLLTDSFCEGAGTNTFSNKTGTIQGSATFTSSVATRSAQGSVRFDVSRPNCSAGCSTIQALLNSNGVAGSCAPSGMSCNCTNVTLSLGANESGPYSISSNSLTINASLSDGGTKPRTFNFCVTTSGTPTLTYRETTAPSTGFVPDPGQVTLTR
ncbi:MAG: hypothetical protein JNK82_25450 [Myxococcaceae bacterium]|nr:hypothetical protein [Myxococcaceae bacterium]